MNFAPRNLLEEKRYAAAAILNAILMHTTASSHEVGSIVEIHPLDENSSIPLHANVDKKHIHGLLLKLGHLYAHGNATRMNKQMETWNNCISSDITDHEFMLVHPRGGNRKMCLHVKQIPRDDNTDENMTLTEEQLQLLDSYRHDYEELENDLKMKKQSNQTEAIAVTVVPPTAT